MCLLWAFLVFFFRYCCSHWWYGLPSKPFVTSIEFPCKLGDSVFCCCCCCRIFSTSTIIFRLRDLEITTSSQPSRIFSVLPVSRSPVDLTARQFVRWRNHDAACQMTQQAAIECDVTRQDQSGEKQVWRITFSLAKIYLKVLRNASFRRRCSTGLTCRRCRLNEQTVLTEQT